MFTRYKTYYIIKKHNAKLEVETKKQAIKNMLKWVALEGISSQGLRSSKPHLHQTPDPFFSSAEVVERIFKSERHSHNIPRKYFPSECK